MGGAIALYSANCFATGKYRNGSSYPITLRAALGLSSWLPGARFAHNAFIFLNFEFLVFLIVKITYNILPYS